MLPDKRCKAEVGFDQTKPVRCYMLENARDEKKSMAPFRYKAVLKNGISGGARFWMAGCWAGCCIPLAVRAQELSLAMNLVSLAQTVIRGTFKIHHVCAQDPTTPMPHFSGWPSPIGALEPNTGQSQVKARGECIAPVTVLHTVTRLVRYALHSLCRDRRKAEERTFRTARSGSLQAGKREVCKDLHLIIRVV